MTLTIDTIEVMRVQIPFRTSVEHALASHDRSDSVVVRAAGSGAVGYGESVPRAYVSGETSGGAATAIEQRLAPAWRGSCFKGFTEVVQALRESYESLARDEHAAFCALELAILDLAGRACGIAAGDVAGLCMRSHVCYSGVVPAGAPERVLAMCEACRDLGFSSVKLKLDSSLDEDLAIVEGARRILGEGCSLRVDANCAWTAEQAMERIDRFAPQRVDAVEQPVAADDLAGLHRLKSAKTPVLIIVDESLVSRADAEALIEADACDVFNVRISKNGGLIAAAVLRDLAIASGIGWMLGAQVGETAILSAAGRQLATHGPLPRWTEGSFGTLLLENDIGVDDVTFMHGGAAPALTGPGLGVRIDEQRLSASCSSAQRNTLEGAHRAQGDFS